MMIRAGSQLICLECSSVAYIAVRDIEHREPITSEAIQHGNGEEIGFQSVIECWKCNDKEIANRLKFSDNWREDEKHT
jgi:hypothetical protein